MSRTSLGFAFAIVLTVTLVPRGARAALPCDPGRFLVTSGALLRDETADAIVPEGLEITIDRRLFIDGCDPTRLKLKNNADGTKLKATFRAGRCTGVAGRVKVKALLGSDCDTIDGTIKRRDRPKIEFSATRVDGCGDGTLDPDAGEQCEDDTDCNDDLLVCSPDCRCVSPDDSATTTSSTTTTTTTATATSSTTLVTTTTIASVTSTTVASTP